MAAAIGFAACAAAPALATFPGTHNGRIAFGGSHGAETGIFTVNPDGSDVRTLVKAGWAAGPAWAPHGGQVAWQAYGQIGLVNVDGSGWTMLTDRSEVDYAHSPTWSPDGKKIAFIGQYAYGGGWYGGSTDIYTVDVDGTNVQKLTDTPYDWEQAPAWSPKGDRIAFTMTTSSTDPYTYSYDIYTVKTDGSDRFNVTRGGYNSSPDWSPDGGRLVFTKSGYGGEGTISTIAADGSGYKDLGYVGASPVYSPDGTTVAFDRAVPYPLWSRAISTVAVGGGALTDVTSGSTMAYEPSWQPLQTAPEYPTPPVVKGTTEVVKPPAFTQSAVNTYVAGVVGTTAQTLKKLGLRGLAKGAVLEQTVPLPGTLQIDVLQPAPTASAAAKKKKRKPKLLARGRATAKAAGKLKVRVKPTRAGRKALKRAKRMRVVVRVTYAPQGLKKTTRSSKLTLKRR